MLASAPKPIQRVLRRSFSLVERASGDGEPDDRGSMRARRIGAVP